MELIPARHTCDGHDISPELFWTGIPEGTRSLILILDDPDAPDPVAQEKNLGSLGVSDRNPMPPGCPRVSRRQSSLPGPARGSTTGIIPAMADHARRLETIGIFISSMHWILFYLT